jgi:hypothetical protein
VRFKVRQTDIDNGERNKCKGCPVARAINRILREPYTAHVGPVSIHIGEDTGLYGEQRIQTPSDIINWIHGFDKGRRGIGPVDFDLPIEPRFLKEGKINEDET